MSFIARIVPSPDWFVGSDSFDLCEEDTWKEQVSVDLYPYDAGTDSGFTFSSPNFATIPQDTITEVTSQWKASIQSTAMEILPVWCKKLISQYLPVFHNGLADILYKSCGFQPTNVHISCCGI